MIDLTSITPTRPAGFGDCQIGPQFQEGEERLCGGFVDAMTALNAKGFYEADPDWRRDWRKHLLALIQQCEDDDRAGIKLDAAQVERRIAESIAAMSRWCKHRACFFAPPKL